MDVGISGVQLPSQQHEAGDKLVVAGWSMGAGIADEDYFFDGIRVIALIVVRKDVTVGGFRKLYDGKCDQQA